MDDDEALDACDLSFDIADKNTDDDAISAVVLYADIDFTDPAAVDARKAEWEALAAPSLTPPEVLDVPPPEVQEGAP